MNRIILIFIAHNPVRTNNYDYVKIPIKIMGLFIVNIIVLLIKIYHDIDSDKYYNVKDYL